MNAEGEGVSEADWKSFLCRTDDDLSYSCSICLETIIVGERSIAKLQCGHEFHLDCIGSAFNAKGVMQCPNCRKVERGHWLYSNGHHEVPESTTEEMPHEELNTLEHLDLPIGYTWWPFGGFTQLASLLDQRDFQQSPYHDMMRNPAYRRHTHSTSNNSYACPYFAVRGFPHVTHQNWQHDVHQTVMINGLLSSRDQASQLPPRVSRNDAISRRPRARGRPVHFVHGPMTQVENHVMGSLTPIMVREHIQAFGRHPIFFHSSSTSLSTLPFVPVPRTRLRMLTLASAGGISSAEGGNIQGLWMPHSVSQFNGDLDGNYIWVRGRPAIQAWVPLDESRFYPARDHEIRGAINSLSRRYFRQRILSDSPFQGS